MRAGTLLALASGLWGCRPSESPVAPHAVEAIVLDRHPDKVERLSVSPSNRPAVPERAVVAGPWRIAGTTVEVRTWEAALPVRPRTLFYHRPPNGMAVTREMAGGTSHRPIHHRTGLEATDDVDTWEFSQSELRVRRRIADGPPRSREYAVAYPAAAEREAELNRDSSSVSDEEFVFRAVQVGDTTRRGLYLPAPSEVAFRLDVPAGAVLDLDAWLVPPEVDDGTLVSDGASVQVLVDGAVEHTLDLDPGRSAPLRVALPQGSHELALRTDARGSTDLDYVFLTEPTVHVPLARPPRAVLVFVDTLRQDHLGLYGYARATSPSLDARAENGAVFTQARSVAPWTLPSARAMLLGAQPETWGTVPTLQERLARKGWATAAFVGNVYLSTNFDMARGFGTHRVLNWPPAEIQVDRALDWLEENDDRPAFVELHLMDPHLPYQEPPQYRGLFAGDPPTALKGTGFTRSEVVRAHPKLGPEGEQYLRDRYDNNIRYVDDEIARFLEEAVRDGDLVVFVSDHGEEFWDHGDFEHGHSLHEELLRVPLVVHGPGITPGRFDTPVSLLDVAPTIATWAGLDTAGMTGIALQTVTDGTAAERATLRPQAFGRPLYGLRRWGVLTQGQKYTVHATEEALYDLGADPGETADLWDASADAGPYHAAMAEALGAPVGRVLRLVPRGSKRLAADLTLSVTLPGGFSAAFVAEDPLDKSEASASVEGDRATIVWEKGSASPREVYLVPSEPTALPGIELSLTTGPDTVVAAAPLPAEPSAEEPVDPWPPSTGRLLSVTARGHTIDLTWGVHPLPYGRAVEGFDPEQAEALKALGYTGD